MEQEGGLSFLLNVFLRSIREAGFMKKGRQEQEESFSLGKLFEN